VHPSRQIKKATALALALGATVPAVASAGPIGSDATPFTAHATPIVHITVPASGFDWGDAGIGAAGGVAIAALGVGGALVITQRRAHHPHRPVGPTS
jgi:hypothetical protein